MAFIGIIADNKHECGLKKFLDNVLNKSNKEHTIILINEKSIDNIKNIKFETILVMNINAVKEKKDILNEIFKKTRYLVINADMDVNLEEIIDSVELNIITFGFNSKSTITASSVEEEPLICVQRKVINIDGKTIEPQEIKVKIVDKSISTSNHNMMGITSILLIYGKNTENF